MDRYLSASLVLAFLVVALLLLVLGWRNRRRRQSHLPALDSVPTVLGTSRGISSGLYVATTLAGERLERVAVRGLGFRSRVVVAVHDSGVVLSIPGQDDMFIPVAAISGVSRSTWTIDRVVEDGGLVCLEWNLGETPVESFFRVEDSEFLLSALTTISPRATETVPTTETKAEKS